MILSITNNQIFKKINPWVIILFIVTGYCTFTLGLNNWNPMAFVSIGSQFDPDHGVSELGYDGQFAYQIAKDPLHASPFLDEPAYRYQRILYPILARILTFGNINAIPWALILINIVSLTLGTLATEKILLAHHHSRWYALAYGGFAGFLLSLRLDLTEPLAFALIQWGILLFDRGKWWRSIPLFALAALTRELTLLFAAACVFYLFSNKRFTQGFLWGLGTLLPFGLWQVFLRLWLGEWGIRSGGARASSFEIIPFKGWWGYPFHDQKIFLLLSVFILFVTLIPAMIGLIVSIRSLIMRHWGLGVWILLFNTVLFPFLPTSNILNLPGLLRITIGLVVAILNYGAIESSKRALRYSQLWLLLLIFGEGLIAIY